MDSQPIADPYVKVVEHLERIAALLLDPPKVHPKFGKVVKALSKNEFIASAVKLMFDNSFSQIPITNGDGHFIELLTTNTISRWLGDNIDVGMVSIEETRISKVLSYKEKNETYMFIRKNATLVDLLDLFDKNEKVGKQVNAILITENGKKSEKLIGIVTHYDLPEIYRQI